MTDRRARVGQYLDIAIGDGRRGFGGVVTNRLGKDGLYKWGCPVCGDFCEEDGVLCADCAEEEGVV